VADAAVAVNAVLAVTQPYCCGVGGDFFCLYHEAATARALRTAPAAGGRAGLTSPPPGPHRSARGGPAP
jgi:gamma-glutamyltranspeptidase